MVTETVGSASKPVAIHTQDTIQIWRDCASLRILEQSVLQAVNQPGFQPDGTSTCVLPLESAICGILKSCSNRVSSTVRGEDSIATTWERMDKSNKIILSYCLSVADKWHECTKLPTKTELKVFDQSISAQIQNVLSDPSERAIKRCRGATDEVYDDAPLYAAILKESVQKGASGDEYAAMKMASKFGKRSGKPSVDTRASKGRKIRYAKIDKLVGFMAARPVPASEGVPITDEKLVNAYVNSVIR